MNKIKTTLVDALTGRILGGLTSFFIPFLGPVKGAMIGALGLTILGIVRRTGR